MKNVSGNGVLRRRLIARVLTVAMAASAYAAAGPAAVTRADAAPAGAAQAAAMMTPGANDLVLHYDAPVDQNPAFNNVTGSTYKFPGVNYSTNPVGAPQTAAPAGWLGGQNPNPQQSGNFNDNWQKNTLPIGNGYMGANIFGGVDMERLQISEKTLWTGGPNAHLDNKINGQSISTMTNSTVQAGDFTTGGSTSDHTNPGNMPDGVVDYCGNPTNAWTHMATAQQMAITATNPNGNSAAAGSVEQYMQTNMMPKNRAALGDYQNFAEVMLDFNYGGTGATAYTNYNRDLDLNTALSDVTYTVNGVNYTRQYFMSYPDDVLVMKLTADTPGALNFDLRPVVPDQRVKPMARMNATSSALGTSTDVDTGMGKTASITAPADDSLLIQGHLNNNDMRFEAQFKVLDTSGGAAFTPVSYTAALEDGKTAQDAKIQIRNATSVCIIMATGTNYVNDYDAKYIGADPHGAVTARINAASVKGFDGLLSSHLADYQPLFSAESIDLGAAVPPQSVTTAALIADYSKTSGGTLTQYYKYLETLYYQYGRYLLISSSRPGTLPAELQGVWNVYENPPWQGDYHMDVNLEMNYWPAYETNLRTTADALVDYVGSLVKPGSRTAQAFFGPSTPGWMVLVSNNPLGYTGGIDHRAEWVPTSAAWLCQNLWDYYDFYRDKQYLQDKIYPTMYAAAQFYSAVLVPNPNRMVTLGDGSSAPRLEMNPSWSAENGPYTSGTTMDQALIWQLFDNLQKAAAVLGTQDDPLLQTIAAQKDRLTPVQTGTVGTIGAGPNNKALIGQPYLKEYYNEADYMTSQGAAKQDIGELAGPKDAGGNATNIHRHISPMVGLYPGNLFPQNPTWTQAAKNYLTLRSDDATGWSEGWKINCWARLGDGNHAYKLIQDLISIPNTRTSTGGGTYSNLLDTCPPFQIDGNFGGTAGMTEMLLQSFNGFIRPLAALPDAWAAQGSAKGLVARGGFQIDESWAAGKLTNMNVQSLSGSDCVLSIPNATAVRVLDSKGAAVQTTPGTANDGAATVSFATAQGQSYTVAPAYGALYTITVSPSADGKITVSPAYDAYSEGDVVTVTATPNYWFAFASWTGDVAVLADPTNPVATFTMPAYNVALTAVYSPRSYYPTPTTGEYLTALNIKATDTPDTAMANTPMGGSGIIEGPGAVNSFTGKAWQTNGSFKTPEYDQAGNLVVKTIDAASNPTIYDDNIFSYSLHDFKDFDRTTTNYDRQRMEIKTNYTGNYSTRGGEIMTYHWKFFIPTTVDPPPPAPYIPTRYDWFFHIFQIKCNTAGESGDENSMPICTFTIANKADVAKPDTDTSNAGELLFRVSQYGHLNQDIQTLCQTDFGNVVGHWMEADVTDLTAHDGHIHVTLTDINDPNNPKVLMDAGGNYDTFRTNETQVYDASGNPVTGTIGSYTYTVKTKDRLTVTGDSSQATDGKWGLYRAYYGVDPNTVPGAGTYAGFPPIPPELVPTFKEAHMQLADLYILKRNVSTYVFPDGFKFSDITPAVFSYARPAAKSVPAGTTFAGLALPASVSATLNNGRTGQTANITWDPSSYDPYKPGQQTVTGTFTNFPFGGVEPSIVVTVTGTVYNVTYYANGGSGTGPAQAQVISGGTVQAAANTFTPPSGAIFAGWNTAADGGGTAYNEGAAITVNGPVDLYAVWSTSQPVVTFDSQGGSAVGPITATYGEPVTRPADPTKYGYTFDNWYLNGVVYDFSKPVTGFITLTAKWIPSIFSTVTFDSAGGSAVAPLSVAYGVAAVQPANPTMSGYSFAGWFLGGAAYDWSAPVTADITLTAHWTELPPVTELTNYALGSAVKVSTVSSGGPAANLVDGNLATTNYWQSHSSQVTAGATNQYWAALNMPAARTITNINIYFQNTSSRLSNLNVAYSNDANAYTALVQGGGTAANGTPRPLVSPGGWTNVWTYAAKPVNGQVFNIQLDTPITAKYLLVYADPDSSQGAGAIYMIEIEALGPAMYNLSYNANGGTGSIAAAQIQGGSAFTAAASTALTAPAGKVFKEWNTRQDGAGASYAAATAATMPMCDLTLYAIWQSTAPATTYADAFPDANFRAAVLALFTDGVTRTDSSPLTDADKAFLAGVQSLDVGNLNIVDLTGIEYFTGLTALYCYDNQLSSLDVSHNTALTELYCYYNKLTSLDVSKNTSLTIIYCNGNQLSSLDVSKNTALTIIDCDGNQLSSLDVSKNTALENLSCGSNMLTSLDVSKNTALTGLYCVSNQLTSLDVPNNIALIGLICTSNQLTSLDVSKNTKLTVLECDNNQLKSLDVSNNTELTRFYCVGNQLTSLDVSNKTKLTDLQCSLNQLKLLNVSNCAALIYIYCTFNELTSLDVSGNTALEHLYCQYNYMWSPDDVKGWQNLGLTINSLENPDSGTLWFYPQLYVAPVITIDTQPAPATSVTQGSITGSLSITASVTQGARLGYQWYSNTTASNTGGTVIGDATAPSFQIPAGLAAGTYYYYCVVSADGAVSVASDVAAVTVTAPVVTYTVTFNANGGSPTPPAQTVTAGAIATMPPAPTKSGYAFDGWFLGGALYNFSAPVNANITLAAQWTSVGPLPPPTSITMSAAQTSLNMKVGTKLSLQITVTPANANPSVTWSSSNPAVATVDPVTGQVTAIKTGSVRITVKSNADPTVSYMFLVMINA